MKYKKKAINKVKEPYGLEKLNFFLGSKRAGYSSDIHGYTWRTVVIASFNHHIKKVYKNCPNIMAERRLTHVELDHFLCRLSDKDGLKWHFCSIPARVVLLEATDSEHSDLESLKTAYLISYLAGI